MARLSVEDNKRIFLDKVSNEPRHGRGLGFDIDIGDKLEGLPLCGVAVAKPLGDRYCSFDGFVKRSPYGCLKFLFSSSKGSFLISPVIENAE